MAKENIKFFDGERVARSTNLLRWALKFIAADLMLRGIMLTQSKRMV